MRWCVPVQEIELWDLIQCTKHESHDSVENSSHLGAIRTGRQFHDHLVPPVRASHDGPWIPNSKR